MPRLFFAIAMPAEFKKELMLLQASIAEQLRALHPAPNFKLEDLANSHCTIRFLGNTHDTTIPTIIQEVNLAIRNAAVPFFRFTLGNTHFFSHRNRARVVWVGLAPEDPFQAIQHAIDRGLAAAKVPVESEHRFHPHLTLLRFREPYRLPEDFEFHNIQPSPTPAIASEVLLIESKTLPQGPIHTVRERFPLA